MFRVAAALVSLSSVALGGVIAADFVQHYGRIYDSYAVSSAVFGESGLNFGNDDGSVSQTAILTPHELLARGDATSEPGNPADVYAQTTLDFLVAQPLSYELSGYLQTSPNALTQGSVELRRVGGPFEVAIYHGTGGSTPFDVAGVLSPGRYRLQLEGFAQNLSSSTVEAVAEWQVTFSVPEPSTALLLAIGGLTLARRRCCV